MNKVTFEHTVTSGPCSSSSLPGDSGALMFNRECQVVGMVIAGCEMEPFTFTTHIDDLFSNIKASTSTAMVRMQET